MVARNLKRVTWNNTRLIKDGAVAELRALAIPRPHKHLTLSQMNGARECVPEVS
jgi:hypothetical protein